MATYLSDADFNSIYGIVPRLNVDLVIRGGEGVLLALRSIEPYLGCWHFPGGTVYKEETISEAARRIAKNETGLDVEIKGCLGYMEFPHEIRSGKGMHTVSIAIEATPVAGIPRHDANASELAWHEKQPENMVSEHAIFMKERGILR